MELSESENQDTSISGIQAAGDLVNLATSLTKNVSAVCGTSTCSDEDCTRPAQTKTLGAVRLFDTQILDSNFRNLADVASQFSSQVSRKRLFWRANELYKCNR